MIFEIYYNKSDNSFFLFDSKTSVQTKEKMAPAAIKIKTFESDYQNVEIIYQKEISLYLENLKLT